MTLAILGQTSTPYLHAYDADTLAPADLPFSWPTTPSWDVFGMATSSDGRIAIAHRIPSNGQARVSIVDPSDGMSVTEVTGPLGITTATVRLKYSPDGTMLAVNAGNVFLVYSTASWATLLSATITSTTFSWAFDSSRLYISRGWDGTTIYNTSGWGTVSWGDNTPTGHIAGIVVFGASGEYVLVTGFGGNTYQSIYSASTLTRVHAGSSYSFSDARGVTSSGHGMLSVTVSSQRRPAIIAAPGGSITVAANGPARDLWEIASRGSRHWWMWTGGNSGDYLRIYDDALSQTSFSPPSGTITGVAFLDGAAEPEYTIEPDVTEADEGDTVTFTITAPDDADLYYQITGDITADDIASGTLTGTITITAGVGSLAVVLLEDGTADGEKEFAVELYTDSGLTELVATSDTVTVADTSTVKTYLITTDTQVLNEGSAVEYTINTEGVVDGSRLWWRKKNTGETETVIVENSPEVEHTTGTITSTGPSTLTDSLAAWTVGEWIGASVEAGGETLVITGNNATTLSTVTPWVVEPTGTYRIFTPENTSEYSSDTPIAAHDIVESETSFLSPGPIIVSAGVGTVTLTLRQDFMTEGPEYIVLDIYDEQGPPFGPGEPVVTSDAVIVLDTSNHEGVSFAVTPLVGGVPSTEVEEGQTITFQVLVSEQPPAPHLLYYQITGTATGADFAGPISGTIEIDESGAGSFSTAIVADSTTEGDETFVFLLKVGYSGGPTVASTPVITILDTSRSPPTYAISAPSSVNEGSTLTATVTTTEVADGTTLYWTTQGDAAAADFTDGQLYGSVTVTGNSASIPRSIKADLITEGQGVADSGTAESGTVNTLTDTEKSWEIDEHATRLIRIISGTGSGQTRQILSNDGDTLTVTEDWTTAPDGTSQYQIYQEAFRLQLRLGGIGGQIVAQTGAITIMDTSVNPPEYYLGQSGSTVAEGSSISFTLTTAFVLDATLYWTISGTATGADFAEGGSGTVSGGGGTITLTALRDYLQEGPETFVLQIRTGSVGGPVVVQSSLVTVLDATYAVTPSSTQIVEGDTVAFTVQTQHHPSATFFWTTSGSVDTDDFVGGALSGVVVVSGGTATISRTLIDDGEGEGPEFFYIELRRDAVDGPIIAISPAVLVRENVPVDFDKWLAESIDSSRAILIEMEHADGWAYFGNVPYISHPDDTDPHRPYDDALYDAVDIETRIDGQFTLGELSIVNAGEYSNLIAKKWRGHQVRILMGEPEWPLDDFRIVILATNGGIAGVEPGYLRWTIYDSKAIFNSPLQDSLLPNEQPIPIALGKPFNVTPALIDDPTHEYQVNDGAVVSVAVRDNGAVVSATVNTGTGTFTLSARPQGNIGADPVSAITTPAQIIAWVCSQYGVTLDGDTTTELPTYDLGLWYASPTTGAQVLTDVCNSIGAYWIVNPLGIVEVYLIDEPDVVPDFAITEADIVDRGLRLIGTEEPVKTLTLNYKRNWSPVSRDSLAGILDTQPAFAEALTQEWRSVTATNTVDDYPLAPDLTISTFLDDPADAQYECNRIAALRAVRRERWEVECFLSVANAQVGKTVGITYPGMGWDEGKTARIVAVRRDLTRNRVTLEVWL